MDSTPATLSLLLEAHKRSFDVHRNRATVDAILTALAAPKCAEDELAAAMLLARASILPTDAIAAIAAHIPAASSPAVASVLSALLVTQNIDERPLARALRAQQPTVGLALLVAASRALAGTTVIPIPGLLSALPAAEPSAARAASRAILAALRASAASGSASANAAAATAWIAVLTSAFLPAMSGPEWQSQLVVAHRALESLLAVCDVAAVVPAIVAAAQDDAGRDAERDAEYVVSRLAL
jgi:hypothetical protein